MRNEGNTPGWWNVTWLLVVALKWLRLPSIVYAADSVKSTYFMWIQTTVPCLVLECWGWCLEWVHRETSYKALSDCFLFQCLSTVYGILTPSSEWWQIPQVVA